MLKNIFVTMWQDFVKFITKNPQYFICSIIYFVIASLLLGGLFTSFLIAFLSYVISLVITFTPLGEKILRFFEHVRKIETKREKEYLLPLFEEVYTQAKQKNPELGSIELCIIDKITVNACALGKRTIAVTKGAIETFSPEELKAMMAHEIAHILYGDTMARLYITVGNGFFTAFILVIKAVLFLSEWIEKIANKSHTSFSFAWFFIILMKFVFMLTLFAVQFLMKFVMSLSHRRSEFRADRYAYDLGYGEPLVEAFYLMEKMQLGGNVTVIQKMTREHPRITSRIERLESLLEQQHDMQNIPMALS